MTPLQPQELPATEPNWRFLQLFATVKLNFPWWQYDIARKRAKGWILFQHEQKGTGSTLYFYLCTSQELGVCVTVPTFYLNSYIFQKLLAVSIYCHWHRVCNVIIFPAEVLLQWWKRVISETNFILKSHAFNLSWNFIIQDIWQRISQVLLGYCKHCCTWKDKIQTFVYMGFCINVYKQL